MTSMTRTTFVVGALLVLTGGLAFALTRTSATALIPAFVGLPVLVCAVVATRGERARRIGLHLALVISLLGLLGSLMNVARVGELVSGAADRPAPIVVSLVMFLLTLVHLVLGVRSFVRVRRARRR